MASSDIPTQKNYFGVRHVKSSCDACTGRVKQGVTRLVKSEQEVVNSAQTFYETCVKHLEKPLIESEDKCQHYILTFEYHKKLAKRPSTANLPAIPDTCKLHQIGNTNGRELYYRKFACCCFGCIHGSEACSNNICPDEWSAYDLGKKQRSQQRSFVQLQRYISANPIPPLAQLQMTLSTSLTQVYWIW